MNVAKITEATISQGFTPAFCACWAFVSAMASCYWLVLSRSRFATFSDASTRSVDASNFHPLLCRFLDLPSFIRANTLR